MSRPTVDDLTGNHALAVLAQKTWLHKPSKKVAPATIRKLWQEVENDPQPPFCILLLEQLQTLEKYLWPGFTEKSSDEHVLLLVLLVNAKRTDNLPTWSLFAERPAEFALFFHRVARLSIDQAVPLPMRTQVVVFLIDAFQSLDHHIVKKECAPLMSIGIWEHIHSDELREKMVAKSPLLQKAWRAAKKKKKDSVFERRWLKTIVVDLISLVYDVDLLSQRPRECFNHAERLLELLCDLQSNLPTRRFFNSLMQDLNLLPAAKLSPMYRDKDAARLRDMFSLLQHYTYFPLDDLTGKQLSRVEYEEVYNAKIARLQLSAYKLQPEKLKLLVTANYGSLGKRDELLGHLQELNDAELVELCSAVDLRTEYEEFHIVNRAFLEEVLASFVESRPYCSDVLSKMNVFPTESELNSDLMQWVEDYDGTQALPLPKLNLQFLSLGDFLWRSFMLYRGETFYSIARHLRDTVEKIKPRLRDGLTVFSGSSPMALPISSPAVVDVLPPRIGEFVPAEVKLEIALDTAHAQRREWESLWPENVVYLLAVNAGDVSNGNASQLPIKALRCAEVINVVGDDRKPWKPEQENQGKPRLLLRMDAISYQADKDAGRDVVDQINVLIRRRARENNFKAVLDSLKQLAVSEDVPLPLWFMNVFLGLGDPAAASYPKLPNRLESIDFRDTFLNWQHLVETHPGKILEPDPDQDSSFPPPYVLETNQATLPSKKRKREQAEAVDVIQVSTYDPPNTGPFPTDAPKTNQIRFTQAQVEAITSGTQPGLTVIVGPPGTGKTDVTTQIISNIYHNFPTQRTVVIAHSNQALNQLFQKITKLDIDPRHLLRLGHGEEELQTEASFSKTGRVESYLEHGAKCLAEVQRLATSINAPGAHGSSCETAEYFNTTWIQPRWKQYWSGIESGADPVATFPFATYFLTAPQPLFPPNNPHSSQISIARGCESYLTKLFSDINQIHPFELLRNARDRSNYLLLSKARIIAMTSTHASIHRHQITSLGFSYTNLLIEESAQITEPETVIPLVMQPRSNLSRIILIGDHLQNRPITSHSAFSSLAQSTFERLVRLHVPSVTLNSQGRARPTIAELYKWRYPTLTNLPLTTKEPFTLANPGLRWEYQFISLPSSTETCPTKGYYQNLAEAEFVVAMYQYLRLLDYPKERITILTPYAGQKALIRDVVRHRCGGVYFGEPKWVGTVDKYQGEENDFVILSMVRTKGLGYLRERRRITVALSRARLGLYVVGKGEVFERVEGFGGLMTRQGGLGLVVGEMWGVTRRGVGEEVPPERVRVVDSPEVLGELVFEMARERGVNDGDG
ncbi:P-loop containing nucleoside triphosphate hydrolase protein [Piedraia hortae CBS 480.64]|uniref:Pre-mRNA-splicing factor n=1 Tax=Piedraia hortae CBS 480.64 TaxID=1314780 RepID=A0A6A7C884_9PEZI|nr:P-loop containing nucleoside triphosphate hydrolase protein [Piedraia hortae CBS 480.64]